MFRNRHHSLLLRGLQIPSAYFVAIVFAGTVAVTALSAKDVNPQETKQQQAQQLAETGVRFELDGAPDYARFAWQAALRADSECALARWRLGYIRSNDTWVSTDESPSSEARTQLISYAHRRDQSSDANMNELALAMWCRNNGLVQQSEVHYRRVLDNPNASEQLRQTAVRALGLKSFGGRLLTHDQIAALQTKMQQARQDIAYWSKQLAPAIKQLQSGRRQKRMLGLEALRQIDDPAAIPAMELKLSTKSEALAYEIVGVIARMDAPEAAESLARHAVASEWPSIRKEASELLLMRSLHDYIPALMAGLQMPIRSVFQITSGADGQILHEHLFIQEGANEHHQLLVTNTAVASIVTEGADNREELNRVRNQANQVESNLTELNMRQSEQNARIYQLLRTTTGQELGSTPTAWWDWWKNYNEYELVANKPVRRESRSRQYAYQPTLRSAQRRSSECFPKGTLVWTEMGKQAIETVAVGDRVLSQHPETGELGYKIVKRVTRRELAPMQTVFIGDHRLTLTTGHPLWVNNAGWRMAKLLKLGDQIHCLKGARQIDRLVLAPHGTAYNLIVDDFGSYFVTDIGVLVHDNTYRRPNRAVSPGLVAKN